MDEILNESYLAVLFYAAICYAVKVGCTFKSVDEISVTIQMKATEQYFPEVQIGILLGCLFSPLLGVIMTNKIPFVCFTAFLYSHQCLLLQVQNTSKNLNRTASCPPCVQNLNIEGIPT